MTQLTLRLVPHNNTKVGFIIWALAPETIKFHNGGVVTLFCPDSKGVGPTFVAELLGIDPVYGWCAEIFVRGDREEHLRSLMDLALKTNGTLIMAGINADQVSELESAWAKRAGYLWEGRPAENARAMHHMIYELGEAYGKQLAVNKLPPDKFKQICHACCQWADGPMEYDGFVNTWKDAVGEGYDGR